MICGLCGCKKEKILTTKTFESASGKILIGDIPATACECGIHVSNSVELEITKYVENELKNAKGLETNSYNNL